MRPRRDYAIAAVIMLVAGAAITARSTDLYLRDAVRALGWALTVSRGIALLAIGAFAGTAAASWPQVSTVVRRYAPGYAPNPRSIVRSVPHGARVAIVIMAGLVAIGAIFVTFALSWALKIDRPIYFDFLHAGGAQDRWGPDSFNEFGHGPVHHAALHRVRDHVPAMSGRRHRLPAHDRGGRIDVPGAQLDRAPPTASAERHAGQHTSYPGGHSIQVALVLLALPLVVWVLTHNIVLRVIGTIIPVAIWTTTEIDTIRTGGHWPIDQTAGLLIAAILLTIVYSVGLDAIRHESCHGPPNP